MRPAKATKGGVSGTQADFGLFETQIFYPYACIYKSNAL